MCVAAGLDASPHRLPRRAPVAASTAGTAGTGACRRAGGKIFAAAPWAFLSASYHARNMDQPRAATREDKTLGTASPNPTTRKPSSRPTPDADPLWACQGLSLPPLSLSHYRMVSSQIESSDLCVSDLPAVRPAAGLRSLKGPHRYPYSTSPQLGGAACRSSKTPRQISWSGLGRGLEGDACMAPCPRAVVIATPDDVRQPESSCAQGDAPPAWLYV